MVIETVRGVNKLRKNIFLQIFINKILTT